MSAAAYDHLPTSIPVHWGITGQIDRELHRKLGAFVYPAAMALVYVFFRLIPYADRGRVGQLREIGIYDLLRSGAVFLFGYGHALALGIGLGWVSRGANFLVGASAILLALWSDHVGRNPPDWLLRQLRHRQRLPGPVQLARALKIAAAITIAGTFTGRWQLGWLLIPSLAALVYTCCRSRRARS